MLPFNAWINLLPGWIQLTILYLQPKKKTLNIFYYRLQESIITSKFNNEKEIKTSFQTIMSKFSYTVFSEAY